MKPNSPFMVFTVPIVTAIWSVVLITISAAAQLPFGDGLQPVDSATLADGLTAEVAPASPIETTLMYARAGRTSSMIELFSFYCKANDTEAARQWINRAMEMDDPMAEVTMGIALSSLSATPGCLKSDDTAAVLLLMKSAPTLNNPEALYLLGLHLLRGVGTVRSDAAGLEFMRKSALRGYAPASVELGDFEMRAHPNDELAAARAYMHYVRAARLNDLRGITRLAHALKTGAGCAENLSESLKLYRLAASRGDVGSMEQLVEFGLNGWGLTAADAVAYAKAAMDTGSEIAFIKYWEFVAHGIGGLTADRDGAIRELEKRAEGSSRVMIAIVRLIASPPETMSKRDKARARQLLERAVARRNLDGILMLAAAYDRGGWLRGNGQRVHELLALAKDKNSEGAYAVGLYYAKRNAKGDMSRAKTLMADAAERGSQSAQAWLAERDGNGARNTGKR